MAPDTTASETAVTRHSRKKEKKRKAEHRSKDAWITAVWKQEWEASGSTRVHRHVSDPGEGVNGEDLSRKYWTTLNRLRTAVGGYRSSIEKWGLADSAACECGEPEQTAAHITSTAAHYTDHHPKRHLRRWTTDQSMAKTY